MPFEHYVPAVKYAATNKEDLYPLHETIHSVLYKWYNNGGIGTTSGKIPIRSDFGDFYITIHYPQYPQTELVKDLGGALDRMISELQYYRGRIDTSS